MTTQQAISISAVADRAASRLREMYENVQKPNSTLIFPVYRDRSNGEIQLQPRISEQEARLAFAIELEKTLGKETDLKHYSIETPTINRYSCFARQNGVHIDPVLHSKNDLKGCSGSIDLSIYTSDHQIPIINIEFKCGTSILHDFEKDLLKLYAESADGIWFHIYKGNKKTFTTIYERLIVARDNLIRRYHFNKKITVYMVALNPWQPGLPALTTHII